MTLKPAINSLGKCSRSLRGSSYRLVLSEVCSALRTQDVGRASRQHTMKRGEGVWQQEADFSALRRLIDMETLTSTQRKRLDIRCFTSLLHSERLSSAQSFLSNQIRSKPSFRGKGVTFTPKDLKKEPLTFTQGMHLDSGSFTGFPKPGDRGAEQRLLSNAPKRDEIVSRKKAHS